MRYGALNPVSDGVQMTVMEEKKLLIDTFVPMKSREASGLPLFVENELAKAGLKLNDVDFWTTGAGPGGFTALRMTAALVAAWALEHDNIKFRCVPAAFALVDGMDGVEGQELDCLFDGRNHEVLLYGLVFKDGAWQSRNFNAVLNENAFKEYAQTGGKTFIADVKEFEAISKITTSTPVAPREGRCAGLIRTQVFPYDNDADNLVYIREAVELRA
jgi:tRNA A37 threonylcarbamoyladenosine modification protein TsaB